MTFSKDQVFCVLDYETYSEAPLKQVGAFEYSVHPSTDILCAAWRIGTRAELRRAETHWWAPGGGGSIGTLYQAMLNPNIILVAHNAYFEQVITRNVFAVKHMYSKRRELQAITPKRWVCTAAMAAALALPRNLENAAKVLDLPVQKDMDGRRLVLKWSKPRKPTKGDPATRHTDTSELIRLVDYCKTDIAAEVELLLAIPFLSPTERRIWELDQAINLRGFHVDRPLVEKILSLMTEELSYIDRRFDDLTGGLGIRPTQRDVVLQWLEEQDTYLPNLQKKTLEDAVTNNLAEGVAKEVLELRLSASKASTKKYQAFERGSRHDSRLRDILLYHAASTGRWAGLRVQVQNLPRGTIKDSVYAASVLATEDLEMIRLIYGDPMSVFSSCVRNVIAAPFGKTLNVGDYAAIEVRVLFWIAKHEAGLRAFREERDLYRELATEIFNVSLDKVTSDQRFVGKTATLGCGYSMSAKKFVTSCRSFGQEVSEELAQAAVTTYRTVHAPVAKSWDLINRAAIAAVENVGKKYSVCRVAWFVRDGFLWCELPSERRLAYRNPSVDYEPSPWGDKRPVLYHWGVDPKTKKWTRDRTYGGKLVENIVQGISRDLMAEAMLRISAKAPWEIVFSVHDELVAERDITKGGSSEEFCGLMAELPPWAEGLPVKVEGWEGDRYRKG